jgi:transposase InsO family protein
MKAEEVQSCIAEALIKAELEPSQRPVLLSDNGACYVSSELKDYLSTVNIKSIHGRVMHPQTQGKIERYHRSMKNIVKLDNYYHPEQLMDAIQDFVEYYNHQRYHESLQNVTPSGVYYGRKELILKKRALIK